MESSEPRYQYFSFSEGGPFHSLLSKMNIAKNKKKLVLFFLLITWLPLMILTAYEGTLFGGNHPFISDVAMHVRLLVALPMLLLIGGSIDARVIEVKRYFSDALMCTPGQRQVFARILNSSCRLADSFIAELILMLIIVAVTSGFGTGSLVAVDHVGPGTWEYTKIGDENILTYAGRWADYISLPIFQFLGLKGLWRYTVWIIMLLRLSRSDMSLQATHPDKAAGLGILMLAQKSFCSFFVALSIVASGELVARLLNDSTSFISTRNDGIGYIVLFLAFTFLPLVFFVTKLIRVKEEGLLRLSRTGASMSNKFEADWVNERSIDDKVAEAVVDPSTMQDYDTVFVSLEEMQVVPFTLKDVILIAIMLFLPYLPVLIIHYSVGELLERLLGLLL